MACCYVIMVICCYWDWLLVFATNTRTISLYILLVKASLTKLRQHAICCILIAKRFCSLILPANSRYSLHTNVQHWENEANVGQMLSRHVKQVFVSLLHWSTFVIGVEYYVKINFMAALCSMKIISRNYFENRTSISICKQCEHESSIEQSC